MQNCIVILFAITTCAAQTSAPPQRELLTQYCASCHNDRLHTAGLVLDKLNIENVAANAEAWEKIADKLRTGTMPPPGLPRPDAKSSGQLVSRIENALDRAAEAKPNPGRIGIHRLNRAEYANAVRDLLGLEVDGRALLIADDAGNHGFDNIAGALSVSPALLERYMSAARKISRRAVGDSAIVPGFETYDVPKMLVQDDRVSDDLPFGSRGGIAIRHYFPSDGEYVVKIRLRRQLYDYIVGVGRAHPLEVRLDGQRIKLFSVGGEAKGRPAPESYAGNVAGAPDWELYMHFADSGLEVRFPAKAGARIVGVSFPESTPAPEGVLQPPQTGKAAVLNELYDGNPSIESVAVGGPYNVTGPGDTPSRRKIFVCRPATGADEPACARRILTALARRAWRRPVSPEDVNPVVAFYESGRKQGNFDSGIEAGLERILVDPEFLFRIEHDPSGAAPGSIYRVSDLELASRLSFFLWSSIPDEELLDLAARGKLAEPAVLERQTRRMFADTRSKSLLNNFAVEWLRLPKLRSTIPDPEVFPEFDENLRQAFYRETELFLDSQMRGDRSVTGLLDANYTFLNERLARHYGIPGVYGSHFRQVALTGDERGGLLGQGSILTVTSYPNRTSPVVRGKWLLENILGSPPPPPPPEVPVLQDSERGNPRSVRERMEQHRANPACAGCHTRMDPLGFALENYDAIGRWRTATEGLPIDASGALPDGVKFEGVGGLRKILTGHREEFVNVLTGKLLTYALGRDLEYYDLPAVRGIVRAAATEDYRWSDIIAGIVSSKPFQMRTAAPSQNQAAAIRQRGRQNDH